MVKLYFIEVKIFCTSKGIIKKMGIKLFLVNSLSSFFSLFLPELVRLVGLNQYDEPGEHPRLEVRRLE
jgi:hypothetical protein